jgi:hypothetical protein
VITSISIYLPFNFRTYINDEKSKAYLFVADDEAEIGYDNWNSEEHVVVIVKSDELNDVVGGLINGFGSTMKKGFVLDLRNGFEDCALSV